MRTIDQEIAFQIALRNCFKEVGGKVNPKRGFLCRGSICNQAHMFCRSFLLVHKVVTVKEFSAFLDNEEMQ